MRTAQLGYIARDTWDADPEAWGLSTRDVEGVYIPAGLLFPYTYKGEVWKLQIRRIGPDVPKDKRYPVVAGSAQGLFQADTLSVNHPALLFEGPINALSAAQEIGDLAACVATGGAALARIDQWKTRLALASQVLLCFDGDEAGKEAIDYWRKRLGESASYLPAVGDGCKDANDMLAAGASLVSWVAPYFFTPIVGPMGPMGLTSSLAEDIPQSFYDRPCWRCGRIGEAQRRMEDGLWLCPCYFPVVQMAMGMREQVSV